MVMWAVLVFKQYTEYNWHHICSIIEIQYLLKYVLIKETVSIEVCSAQCNPNVTSVDK